MPERYNLHNDYVYLQSFLNFLKNSSRVKLKNIVTWDPVFRYWEKWNEGVGDIVSS